MPVDQVLKNDMEMILENIKAKLQDLQEKTSDD